jgi:Prolyl oligopeptidase family
VPIILGRKHPFLRSILDWPEVLVLFELKPAALLVCLFSTPACPTLLATDTGASYEAIDQERSMGMPELNVKGYHDGLPIHFAEGLEGRLRIIHGSGDDNVHFQGTELLIKRPVALGKPFDFTDFPNRTHALNEGSGTSFLSVQPAGAVSGGACAAGGRRAVANKEA